MKNLLLIVCLTATLALTACATTKFLQPIGGSKADGTVTLAYDYNAFENPQIDWNVANETAKQRCQAWGFRNAQVFGGQQSACNLSSANGACYGELVKITYQCTK